MGGWFKKICKEICRPFRQGSRSVGRFMRTAGGKRFGNFIENVLNTIIDTVAITGASLYGGPFGVSAITAVLAGSNNLSDKDIFKASILGGVSSFVSILSNELIIAKGLGIQTVATTGIMNGSIAAASGQNVIKGVAYGYGGLICPSNPLLVAAIKTIAEKDIDAGVLHVVGFETGKYVQSYINAINVINKQIKEEDKEIFGTNKKNISRDRINLSIKKDVELYNLVKDELIEPFNESLKTDYVNSDKKIKHLFDSVHEKINDSTWKLKTRISMKTNEQNLSLTYKISPDSGIALTADINKHLGLNVGTDEWSVSTGLSNIYPRGFVVKYTTHEKIENNSIINVSEKFLDEPKKGYCYTTKTYNTTGTDSVKMTSEYHMNADCAVIAGVGATAAVIAPQIVIPVGLTFSMVPAIAFAKENNDTYDSFRKIKIDKKTLSYKINSGNNPKLNYKISEMLRDCNMIK